MQDIDWFGSDLPPITRVQTKTTDSNDDPPNYSVQAQAVRAPWEVATGGAYEGVASFEGIINVLLGSNQDEIPAWSIYPRQRDAALRKLYKREPIMAGAVYSFAARLKSLPWRIESTKPRVKAYYQNLFAKSDFGAGWGSLITKTVIDICTQDNGFFWELEAPGNPLKQRKYAVTRVNHMDSAQCWRTFDPEYPVLYINPYTYTYHRLHKSRVVFDSSCTQPTETARGIGFCAVSRVLLALETMRSIEIYKNEKVSGRFKRAIGYGSGINPKQFEQAIAGTNEQADNAGFSRYMGIPFVFSNRDSVNMGMVDLASLSDGFDPKSETETYVNTVALGFGTDSREFWPATSIGATKADAEVSQLKSRGKGIGDCIQIIEHACNWEIIGEDTGAELKFDEIDDQADEQRARVHRAEIDNTDILVKNGTISPQESRAILISKGVIDVKALDITQNQDLADDSAPIDNSDDSAGAVTLPTTNIVPPEPVVPATKEAVEISGDPLPTDQATEVSKFDPKEIDALFEAFSSLPKVSAVANA